MRDDEPKPVVSSGLEDSLHVYNRGDCLALLCLADIVCGCKYPRGTAAQAASPRKGNFLLCMGTCLCMSRGTTRSRVHSHPSIHLHSRLRRFLSDHSQVPFPIFLAAPRSSFFPASVSSSLSSVFITASHLLDMISSHGRIITALSVHLSPKEKCRTGKAGSMAATSKFLEPLPISN